jgi:hypothetical protein
MSTAGLSCSYLNSNVDHYRQQGCDELSEVRKLF